MKRVWGAVLCAVIVAGIAGVSTTARTRSIAQLSDGQPLTRQAISKHLRVLEDAQIVRSERAGRENLYVLNPQPIADLGNYIELVSSQWDAALSRLKAFVEE